MQKKLQEDFSPLKMKLKNINSLDKAIQSEAPSIGKIMADTNPEYTQSLLIMWLLWLDQNMSERGMTENQIENCAVSIMQRHKSLKLSDLSFVFDKIIHGEIELYGSLGINKIIKILDAHFNERCEYSAQKSESKHMEFNQGIKDFGDKRSSVSNLEMSKKMQHAVSHQNIQEAKNKLNTKK